MSCSIIDTDFIDDLLPYNLKSNQGDGLSIVYDDGQKYTIDFNWTAFNKMLPRGSNDIWYPIIADVSNSSIETKKIDRNFSLASNKIGIESFIKFTGKFRNWEIAQQGNTFCLDWMLNDDNFIYDALYGIIGWVKFSQPFDKNTAPINTVFTNSDGNRQYVKYSEDLFIDLTKDSPNNFISIGDLPSDISTDYSNKFLALKRGDAVSFEVNFYIADGDFLAYNTNSAKSSLDYSGGISPLTHISPTIWKDYQHIYDIITKAYGSYVLPENSDEYDGSPNIYKIRNLKRLSGALATHPLRDRITQECLSDPKIVTYIQNFVNNRYNNITLDIASLRKAINNIFSIDSMKNLSTAPSTANSNDGFINTPSDLFSKLLYKYKPYIFAEKDLTITYNKPLNDGPHVLINNVATSHCNKNTSNTKLINNIGIKLTEGDSEVINFRTDYTKSTASYKIKNANGAENLIPLFDGAKKFPLYDINQNIGFSAGPDIYLAASAASSDSCGKPEELSDFDFENLEVQQTTIDDEGNEVPLFDDDGNPIMKIVDVKRYTGTIDFPSYKISKDNISKLIGSSLFPFFDIESIGIEWSLAAGNSSAIKIINANTIEPELEFSSFGKYTLNLTAFFGDKEISDTVDIYVVNNTGCNVGIDADGLPAFKTKQTKQLENGETVTSIVDTAVDYVPAGYYSSTRRSNISLSINRNGDYVPYLDYRGKNPLNIVNDRNRAMVPGIVDIAISKYGAVAVYKSNAYVEFVSRAILPLEDGQFHGQVGNATVVRLDNYSRLQKFYFTPKESYKSASISIDYRPEQNAQFKIYKIRLDHLRSPSNPSCHSIYQNALYQWNQVNIVSKDRETVYGRDIPGGAYSFNKYSNEDYVETIELPPMPELSTYNMPTLNALGGNGGNPLTPIFEFGGNAVGHVIDIEDTVCILRPAEIESDTSNSFDYPSYNPNIKFTKGTFHPGIGFISGNNQWRNLTSTLKFNTGNKNTFVFKGPGFLNRLKNPGKQSSGITLSLSRDAWDVEWQQQEGSDRSTEKFIDVSENDDISIHHGYRRLSGNFPTRTYRDYLLYDEYDGSYGNYEFAVRGRRLSISNRLYGSDLMFCSLKNLEVKLNFINQINLKNTKIWIEVSPCSRITSRIQSRNAGEKYGNDPYYYTLSDSRLISNIAYQGLINKGANKKISNTADSFIKHTKMIEYLEALKNLNEPYKLILLNEEHVDSNSVDTILHFSDRFSKNLTARNMNLKQSLFPNQDTNTTNYIKLQPSLHLAEHKYYKSIINRNGDDILYRRFENSDAFINAIKTNDLYWLVNTFSKYYNQQLFMGRVFETDPPGTIAKPDSSISVTLHMEVLDEHDMQNIDRVSNIDKKLGQDLCSQKQSADTVFNSLCSWEIIFDTAAKEFRDTDALGHIKYGYAPKIPGYNYISDDVNIKHKLPQSNIDAPNQQINDMSTCYYDQTTDDDISPLRRPVSFRFPDESIALALAALALGAFTTGLIGLSIGFGVFLSALSAVTRFLSNIRRQQLADSLGRVFEKSVYVQRPQSGSDKILLHVNTNGPIVYDLEASICKYSNTPILKRKVRNYVKPGKDLLPELGTFTVHSNVGSLEDIFEYEELIDGIVEKRNYFGKTYTNITANENTIVKSDGQLKVFNDKIRDTLFDQPILSKLDNTNIPLQTLAKNNLLSLDLEAYKRMALIKGTRAYNYFSVDQVIQTGGDSHQLEAKGKIIKDNVEYTILQFYDKAPSAGSTIYLEEDDNPNIIVWTDREPDHYNTAVPTQIIPNTLFPKGPTYGAGTPVVNSSYLSQQPIQNNILSIYDIFNNQECNAKPSNKVEIYSSGTKYGDMIEYPILDEEYSYTLGVNDAPEVLQGGGGNLNYNISAGYSYNLNNILNVPNRLSAAYQYIKDDADDTVFSYDYLLKNIHNNGPDSPNIVEINNQDFQTLSSSNGNAIGYVVVNGDYEYSYAYGFGSNNDISQITDRLRYLDSKNTSASEYEQMSIKQLQAVIENLSEDPIECEAAGSEIELCPKQRALHILNSLHVEKNQLLNMLDKTGYKFDSDYDIIYVPQAAVPQKIISWDYKGESSAITNISEQSDNDKYWINIDPYQQCKTSRDASIKILVKAEYICIPSQATVAGELGVIPIVDRDAQNVCPTQSRDGEGNTFTFKNEGNKFTYTFTQQNIQRQKDRYKSRYGIQEADWEEVEFPGPNSGFASGNVTRSFFIRPNKNSQDIYIEVKETYLVPNEAYHKQYFPTSEYTAGYLEYKGKVKDIIPGGVLSADNLVCRSKVIPRKLRRLDTFYQRYKFDFNGNYVEALPSIGPGGPFTTNMALWSCYDSSTFAAISTPDYFKIKNEMIYRAYFGSKDNIEYTNAYEDSKDPFEWIPYEYDHFNTSKA